MRKIFSLVIGTVLFSTIVPGIKANAEVLRNTNGVQAIQTTDQNGWVQDSGVWYFYKNGSLVKGWLQDNGSWYYLDPTSGSMKKDWQQINGSWYYLDPTYGYMRIGWQQINNKWYYLDPTYGYMRTGWQKIDGKEYYFWTSEGSMASDTTVDGKYLGKDGAYVAQTEADKIIAEARAHMPFVTYVYAADDAERHIFDCSSFTKHIFAHQGISLGRTTWNQMEQGVEVSQANLRAGDLVFTLGGDHVGIYTSNGKMIHNSREGINVIESNITDFYKARRIL